VLKLELGTALLRLFSALLGNGQMNMLEKPFYATIKPSFSRALMWQTKLQPKPLKGKTVTGFITPEMTEIRQNKKPILVSPLATSSC
jgi:hypothetical protein